MLHPDHEIRIGAHRIFSVVLVPSSVSPCSSSPNSESKNGFNRRTLSRTGTVFSSSAALFEKLRKEMTSFKERSHQDNKENVVEGEKMRNGRINSLKFSYSIKNSLGPTTTDENPESSKETVSYGNSIHIEIYHLCYGHGCLFIYLSISYLHSIQIILWLMFNCQHALQIWS